MSRARLLIGCFGLALTSVACSSTEPPEPAPVVDLAAHALGVAVSPCGRYTLRLDHAEWSGEPHERPRLRLQMTCETGDENAFVCGGARVTDLVSEAGVHWREKGLGGHARAGRWGGVFIHDLEQYERADTAQRLRVECHVMRVFDWRTFDVSCAGPGSKAELICPPYHVGVFGEPDMCKISAYCTDDWTSFPPAERDLFGLIGHDWVAGGVELLDADGQPLPSSGAGGSGGHTTAMYGPPMYPEHAPGPIRYPVTGTLRLPGRYVIEVVPFEFTDLRLVRE